MQAVGSRGGRRMMGERRELGGRRRKPGLVSCAVRKAARSRAGVSVLEITVALTIATTVLAASAGAFLSNLAAARSAQRTSRGAVFLQTVMQDLSAQSYDALPAFNGNHIFDRVDEARSNYSVTLTVFQAAVGLEQVQAVLTDLRTDTEIGKIVTFRSQR